MSPSPSPDIVRNLYPQFRKIADPYHHQHEHHQHSHTHKDPLFASGPGHSGSSDRLLEAWKSDPYDLKTYSRAAGDLLGGGESRGAGVGVGKRDKGRDGIDRGSSDEIVEEITMEELEKELGRKVKIINNQ